MTTSITARESGELGTDGDAFPSTVDVLVVGAGIAGVYSLYIAREAGFSVRMLEAGSGVGGTWYWNRYPECRFDSESYTYGYLFSEELFDEWDWTEHFSGQPEVERYMNHVIDKFDLRRLIRFGSRVTSAVYDEATTNWRVRAADGTEIVAHYVISATGVLSVPYIPNIPGREDFKGEAYHTGLWPKTPVDVVGKRVAVIGVGSSGVQVVPAFADEVASMTVYQRTANWASPLNNRPITPEEQADLKARFPEIREILNTSFAGFLHQPGTKKVFDDTEAERLATFEQMWAAQGFSSLGSFYIDLMTDPAANKLYCDFMAAKIREIVKDPETAEKLIPKDHGYGGKRPPFGTGYYEAYNNPKVSLIDLKETPILRLTETGIETADGVREFDIIVWATGFDFGTGALNRMGVRGRGGLPLEEHWKDGPVTFLGLMAHGFPNFFFPGGPHGSGGNNPRYAGDQSNFINDALIYARDHGYREIEVPTENEKAWTAMIDDIAAKGPYTESSYFLGSNIPGKPRRLLFNPSGRPKLFEMMNEVTDNNYEGFMS
jgi:cation diffusion facilitator CzcD-associated flavoprotein CzcO